MADTTTKTDFDFLIVGAGLSGINAAYRVQTQLPSASFAVLESRDRIGGTWSFFRFPGLRSDSQLTLFGLPWRPWVHKNDVADAALIREYLEGAARDEGIDRKIRFGHRVEAANFDSAAQQWVLTVRHSRSDGGGSSTIKELRAKFLLCCNGYYDYETPLKTTIPGIENFGGTVAHPQFWPADLDWAGKKVVVIGSGATAVTMLPVLAETAAHATLLQRSPSYVFTVPRSSPVGGAIKRWLPGWLAHPVNWWRCYLAETLFVLFNLTFPAAGRRLLTRLATEQLPLAKAPVDPHFTPRYDPFDQRLCMTPDGEFFRALHRDNCDIVTDTIETVASDGIVLKGSGDKIDADIIVTATGLHVRILGGMNMTVDGKAVDVPSSFVWRGCMLTGMPNAGCVIGYTTASWTMGCDCSTKMLLRVYRHMKKKGMGAVVPVYEASSPDGEKGKPIVGHSSTYFVQAQGRLPRVTGKSPWYGRINSVWDTWFLWFGSVEEGMRYYPEVKKGQ